MKILETEHEKKSFTITTVLFILLFLLLLFLKLTVDPIASALEGGGGGGEIAINFGNSEVGSGKNYRSKVLDKPKSKAVPVKSVAPTEKVLTQETTEAPVISQTKEVKKVISPKPVVKPAPKPSKSTSDALSSIMNGSKSGDGNDRAAGNKGKLNGDPNATGYNGGGGSGTGSGGGNGSGTGLGNGSGYGNGSGSGTGNGNGNYQLGNRKALNKPQPSYLCDEQGTVVVQIYVDRNGKVIGANPGIKGTTNTAKCLLDQAKIAAMNTRWQSDNNAPDKQTGKIIYNFKLTQ
jgi:outer membrane biosynthesis protein TonB